MIAFAGVDAADQRELIEHRGLFRQMFANHDAGQLGLRDAEGTAVLERLMRLWIPHINVAWPAGHPQENDALATWRKWRGLRRLAAGLQQGGNR